MARLDVVGGWHGPGEERAAQTLAEALPEGWVVVANRDIPDGTGTRELDLVVVGDRLVFVCEEKFWGPQVRVREGRWWFVNGSQRPNPNNQVQQSSKVLAGRLRERVPGWKAAAAQLTASRQHLVRGHVLLSHPRLDLQDSDNLAAPPLLAPDVLLSLADAPARLVALDAAGPATMSTRLRRALLAYLQDLEPSLGDRLPEKIHGFTPVGKTVRHGDALTIPVTNDDGALFDLLAVPVEDQEDPVAAHRLAVRDYIALEALAATGRARRVESWFRWDRYVLTPVRVDTDSISLHQLIERGASGSEPGSTSSKHPPRQVVADAFAALAEVHTAGICHRALQPRSIELAGRTGRVRFIDFTRSRIATRTTLRGLLDADSSDAFAPPRRPVAVRGEPEDVYSLALSLLLWLRLDPSDDPDHAACSRHAADRGDEVGRWLRASLDHDPVRRPHAAEVARALGSGPPSSPGATGHAEPNRYEYRERIGKGGMGEVWRAFDTRMNRHVAIKRLPAAAVDDADIDLFRREARLVAGLEAHPHIISVYDFGVDDDLYLVMPYIKGHDLREELRTAAPLPPARVLWIVDQIAKALDRAHAEGLVHRDVTPKNVLLADDYGGDFVYLIDFGIASAGTRTNTAAAATRGTVAYMAPERLTEPGSQAARDPAVDVYSLGCVLYEMLTGHPPFAADDAFAVARMHIDEAPPQAPQLPAAVNHVIATALAKSPEHRYSTVGALATSLRQAFAVPTSPLRTSRPQGRGGGIKTPDPLPFEVVPPRVLRDESLVDIRAKIMRKIYRPAKFLMDSYDRRTLGRIDFLIGDLDYVDVGAYAEDCVAAAIDSLIESGDLTTRTPDRFNQLCDHVGAGLREATFNVNDHALAVLEQASVVRELLASRSNGAATLESSWLSAILSDSFISRWGADQLPNVVRSLQEKAEHLSGHASR